MNDMQHDGKYRYRVTITLFEVDCGPRTVVKIVPSRKEAEALLCRYRMPHDFEYKPANVFIEKELC